MTDMPGDILAKALEAGFMISTAHGQGKNKIMPVSDRHTLEHFAQLVKSDLTPNQKATRQAILEDLDAIGRGALTDTAVMALHRVKAMVEGVFENLTSKIEDAELKAAVEWGEIQLDDWRKGLCNLLAYGTCEADKERARKECLYFDTLLLKASQPVQEVTVEEQNIVLVDITQRSFDWIHAYFKNNNLRIVKTAQRGEGE